LIIKALSSSWIFEKVVPIYRSLSPEFIYKLIFSDIVLSFRVSGAQRAKIGSATGLNPLQLRIFKGKGGPGTKEKDYKEIA
jgi:hypothetical protein